MQGVILMTALVPTVGHQYLIDFAYNFMRGKGARHGDKLNVIVCTRSTEPALTQDRVLDFCGHYIVDYDRINFFQYEDDNAPQNPEDHPDFWNFWKGVVEKYVKEDIDYFFASEKYGHDMAKLFKGCEYIPVDEAREIIEVKGTEVRTRILDNWNSILPETQRRLRPTITFFGAESTGKTTISKKIAKRQDFLWVHEWARPYLESVGKELTKEKMDNIVVGQSAAQNTAHNSQLFYPAIIRDTDLLSTIGYYRIMGWQEPQYLIDLFEESKSDLYIVMNTDIPFEEDPLRYGGNKRESDTKFWIDLLDEFKCNYILMTETDRNQQTQIATKAIYGFLFKRFEEITKFQRD